MTTAITPTLLLGPIVEGVKEKRVDLSLLLPTVWAAAGHAVDFSTYFDYVTRWKFTGTAVTDYGAKFNLIGTEGTGANAGALATASTISVVAHHDSAAGGGAEGVEVLDAMPNSSDPSTWDCNLTVWGY